MQNIIATITAEIAHIANMPVAALLFFALQIVGGLAIVAYMLAASARDSRIAAANYEMHRAELAAAERRKAGLFGTDFDYNAIVDPADDGIDFDYNAIVNPAAAR